jgi:hypothetical protein
MYHVPYNLKKHRLTRKLASAFFRVPRLYKQRLSTEEDYRLYPPLLCNSFPKSGTHLLQQILESFPEVVNYGTFIASRPALTYHQISLERHLRLIQGIAPAELITSHMHYYPELKSAIRKKNCLHFFIYRDPRDVVVSETLYLTYQYKTHRLHRFFSNHLTNDEERITISIKGVDQENVGFDFPNIRRRFEWYAPWISDQNTQCIKFEDLVNDNKASTVGAIVNTYLDGYNSDINRDDIITTALKSIDPKKSHTYRSGKIGGWRGLFTPGHIELMKSIAGQLLIDLGYEHDLSW